MARILKMIHYQAISSLPPRLVPSPHEGEGVLVVLLKCSVLLYPSIRFFYWGKISDGGVCFGYAEALSYFQMTGDLRVSAANFA